MRSCTSALIAAAASLMLGAVGSAAESTVDPKSRQFANFENIEIMALAETISLAA